MAEKRIVWGWLLVERAPRDPVSHFRDVWHDFDLVVARSNGRGDPRPFYPSGTIRSLVKEKKMAEGELIGKIEARVKPDEKEVLFGEFEPNNDIALRQLEREGLNEWVQHCVASHLRNHYPSFSVKHLGLPSIAKRKLWEQMGVPLGQQHSLESFSRKSRARWSKIRRLKRLMPK